MPVNASSGAAAARFSTLKFCLCLVEQILEPPYLGFPEVSNAPARKREHAAIFV